MDERNREQKSCIWKYCLVIGQSDGEKKANPSQCLVDSAASEGYFHSSLDLECMSVDSSGAYGQTIVNN